VAGEQEFPVLPLAVPPADRELDPATVRGYDAVALLVARARAADPGFDVTPENATALAAITARLDGLPLAIELGAGRLRLLTPQSLLERLERRLPLLATGTSDTIDRHQTLRAAIAWSYELLDPTEQRLFRRLAPLVGPFTAEAAAAVADLPLDDTWPAIESLLTKSLLHRPVDVGQARFAMLQTLREFAFERLESAGELEAVLARHARFFLGLAEAAGRNGGGQAGGLEDRLPAADLEDVLAVLRRCARGGDRELGLRLASATWRTWQAAGRLSAGREWLSLLLEGSGPSPSVRAEALVALAGVAYWQADYEQARAAYQEALALYRELGQPRHEADVLYGLSMTATWSGDPAEGRRLATEARTLFEGLGARAKIGEALMAQGFATWQQREYEEARPLWQSALAISREIGDDALAVTQLAGLAGIAHHTGDAADATRIALEALAQACDLDNVGLCVWMLDFLAAFAVAEDPTAAVRLAGAADALREASGGGMPVEDLHIEPAQAAAGRTLSHSELERAWAEGRAMSLEEAIEAARALGPVSVA
jgi:predicted ATPase